MSNIHLRDKDLSLSARGLLSTMLSLPPDWNYTIRGLASICKEGEKAVKSTLDELKQHGYLVVTKHSPDESHKTYWYEYDVYEDPLILQESTKPQVSQAYPSEGVDQEGVVGEGLLGGRQINIEGLSTNEASTENISPSQKRTKRKAKPFVPPTLEEVQAYVSEKGYHFSAQSFFDYYSASNWHFANGKPVKSWKQCCVTWENNGYSSGRRRAVSSSDYRDYD